ncbi:MAG: esterase-like activity of phytase family protein [Gemmobacter sp.]
MRRRSVLALMAGAAAATRLAAAEAPAAPRTFVWRHADRRFGGLSAIHLWPDGRRFLAVGDRGHFFAGRLRRYADDAIASARIDRIEPLRGPSGSPLGPAMSDAEGVAVAPDGRIFVAFEGRGGGRVWEYAAIDAPARPLPAPPEFGRFRPNRSLEALAIDAQGRLWTLPEDVGGDRFPLFRFDGRAWAHVAGLPRRGPFLAVGADFGPDGRLYLLERAFRLPLRFATRLSRFRPGAWDRPETLFESDFGEHDNVEGVSVTRDAGGRLRATLVSDDNFLFLQRTELLELTLPE